MANSLCVVIPKSHKKRHERESQNVLEAQDKIHFKIETSQFQNSSRETKIQNKL